MAAVIQSLHVQLVVYVSVAESHDPPPALPTSCTCAVSVPAPLLNL